MTTRKVVTVKKAAIRKKAATRKKAAIRKKAAPETVVWSKPLKPISAWAASVGRALRRAARRARREARFHGTKIYIWKDGKVVAIDP